MARYKGPVLVDTNSMLESWRTGSWRALVGGYVVETVEDCVIETQTGYQNRAPERWIDQADLRAGLAAVHTVTPTEHARAALRDPMFAMLDTGERALWAHALSRSDGWLLCGPDKASLRFGVRQGLQAQLMDLETLLVDAGHRPKGLARQYTREWHKAALSDLIASERRP